MLTVAFIERIQHILFNDIDDTSMLTVALIEIIQHLSV